MNEMRIATLAIMSLLISRQAVFGTYICDNDWHELNGKCWYLSTTKQNFITAQQKCEEKEANLASVHSELEHNFTLQLMNESNTAQAWIGLEDPSDDLSLLSWTDNTEVDYVATVIDLGHIPEKCVRVKYLQQAWWDRGCHTIYHYICKKNGTLATPCSSNPCQNDATCNDGENQFSCSCPLGYDGITCDNDINECSSNPCMHLATCIDNLNSYTCQCVTGYNGNRCQTNINDCDPNPCQNGGSCNDLVNDFTCTCITGSYTGTTCEQELDECGSSPCNNNGTCTNANSFGYSCSCTALYTGTQCEYQTCTNTTCQNMGICIDTSAGAVCNCTENYHGRYCQSFYQGCHSEDYLDINVTGVCYKFHTEATNITAAKETCRNEDASLATILSADEQNAVYNKTSNLNENAYWWIGLTDENNEQGSSKLDWEWMDESVYEWNYWDSSSFGGSHTDEPKDDTEGTHDYVLLGPVQRSGHWLTADNSLDRKFICKASKMSIEETEADLKFQHRLTEKNCSWNATEIDRKIKDYLIREITNISSVESCLSKCANVTTCLSMQYKTSDNLCQLNYVTRLSLSNFYMTRSGWNYRDYTCTGDGRTFQHITTGKSCTWNNAVEKRKMYTDSKISTTYNKTLISCRNMCEVNNSCKSIGYKSDDDLCHLYNESRTSVPSNYIWNRDFVYYDFSCSETIVDTIVADNRKRDVINFNKDRLDSQAVVNVQKTNPVIFHAGRSASSCIVTKRVSRHRTAHNKYCVTLYFAPEACTKAKMKCAVNKSSVLLVNATADHKKLAIALMKQSSVYQICTGDNVDSINGRSQAFSEPLDLVHAGIENKCVVYSLFQEEINFSLLPCDMQFPILCLSEIK